MIPGLFFRDVTSHDLLTQINGINGKPKLPEAPRLGFNMAHIHRISTGQVGLIEVVLQLEMWKCNK